MTTKRLSIAILLSLALILMSEAGFAQMPRTTPSGNITVPALPSPDGTPTIGQPALPLYLNNPTSQSRIGALRFGSPTDYKVEIAPGSVKLGQNLHAGSAPRVFLEAFSGGLALTGTGHLSFAQMKGFLLPEFSQTPPGAKGALYYHEDGPNSNDPSRRLPRYHDGTDWGDFAGTGARPIETILIVPSLGGDVNVSGAVKRTYSSGYTQLDDRCRGLALPPGGDPDSAFSVEEVCQFDALFGDKVTLSVILDSGKAFSRWYGGPCDGSTESTCEFFAIRGAVLSPWFTTPGSGGGGNCPGDPSCPRLDDVVLQ